MSEEGNVAAAILAVEASRQEHEHRDGAAVRPKDVKAELWQNYVFFRDRLSGSTKFVSRLISDDSPS
jgi:sarcosine oxidase delta subunit